jgi:hypothetical protein
MKHALIAVVLLTLGGVTAGCGGDDADSSAGSSPSSASSSPADAPTDASTDDMCGVLSDGASIKDGGDVVDFAHNLQDAGTPSDIPSEARDGFEVYVKVLEDIDPDLSSKELAQEKPADLSKDDQANVQAFLTYAGQTCAPSAPSGSESQPSAPSSSGS